MRYSERVLLLKLMMRGLKRAKSKGNKLKMRVISFNPSSISTSKKWSENLKCTSTKYLDLVPIWPFR